MPHLAAFSRAYPDVTVELHCENRFIDLVAMGFDAGFRLGESLANDVVAVPIGQPIRLATFASPGYLATHGAPQVPADLLLSLIHISEPTRPSHISRMPSSA